MNLIDYITIVGDELQDKLSHHEFKNIVSNILNDKNGWNTHNIKFNYVNNYNTINVKMAKKLPNTILKIYIHDGDTTNKICEMRGLSCTRFKGNGNPIDIIINYDNWMGGSKSKLPIDDYRKYVINHEVGHWLGLEHSKCPLEECRKRGIKDSDCPASIMQQMSKGLDHIAPCKESCTPLPPDWKVDNIDIKYNIEEVAPIPNKQKKYQLITIIIYIIILIVLIIFFIYYIYKNKC
jgi:hypothetical protein